VYVMLRYSEASGLLGKIEPDPSEYLRMTIHSAFASNVVAPAALGRSRKVACDLQCR
jgi:hypothetical protein